MISLVVILLVIFGNKMSDLTNFLQSSPLGISYTGDDKITLSNIENKIAAIIDNKAIIGTIVSKKGEVLTSLDDIKKAVKLAEGFKKNAQANLKNLDAAIKEEERPSATLNQLSQDTAAGQAQSVFPVDSQQIAKTQIDAPKDQKFCDICQTPMTINDESGLFLCEQCKQKQANSSGFLRVQDRFVKLAELLVK
jgi:ribosomal protein L37AE/L43A